MIATCRTAEISAVTQPPFFLSRPADSIRTSSNMVVAPLRFRVDANLGFMGESSLSQRKAARQRVHRSVGRSPLTVDRFRASTRIYIRLMAASDGGAYHARP